jgi:photosystem II stability/assembly factor-like uncharacterized protein
MKKLYIFLTTLFFINGAMAQWFPQNSGTFNDLNSVFFTDANTGYAVGDMGTILKTINAGTSWISLQSGTNLPLEEVYFPCQDTGYAVGGGGFWNAIILKTINGGVTWTSFSTGADYLYSVYFLNSTIGFAVGSVLAYGETDSGVIFKTNDGGTYWTGDTIRKSLNLTSVFFTDFSTGYAVGNFLILKTVDGGTTWTPLSAGGSMSLNSVCFTDSITGFAVGVNGTIIKTINAGNLWTELSVGSNTWLYSINFPEIDTGYVVGFSSSEGGVILKTTNGGENWNQLASGTGNRLFSVHFTDANTGYAVGSNGTILKTTNGGGYPVGVKNQPHTSNLLKIYPNPASNKIIIENSGEGLLSIQNLYGQELLNQHMSDASSQIDINRLPSGIYIMKLTNEKTMQVRKFIKE